jgi:fibronectin-binding autotransporter adhesin
MKRNKHTLLAALALLLPAAAQAQTGTATVNASGNWNSVGTWSSTPGGFAPINGQNGQNWNAIINNGSRTVTVNAGTVLEGLNFSAGVINGTSTLTLNAASTWSGGNFTDSGITHFNGGVAITANGQSITSRTVNLGGSSTIGDGSMGMHVGTLANNGVFDITNVTGLTVSHSGFGGTWSNTGTINKGGAGATTLSSVSFNNTSTGIVNVNEGMINVAYQGNGAGGGTSTGTFNIASGAEFRVSGATYHMNAGVQVHGSGAFTTAGGTVNFNGSSISNTGNFALTGGTMAATSGATLQTSGTMTMSGGLMDGPGTASFGGASTWTGGNFGGTGITNFNGGVAITASGQLITSRTVNLGGSSTIGDGSIAMHVGTLANNGVFSITNVTGLTVSHSGFGGTWSNTGTINKGGAGTTTFSSVSFNNPSTGIVNVNEGMINVAYQGNGAGGGTAAGTFNIASGAEFRVSGPSYTMNAGVQVNGAGIFNMTGGTTTFNGTSTGSTGNLGMTGGTVTFASGANFTTSGGLQATNGMLNGSGTSTFHGASTWTGGNFEGGVTNMTGGVAITGNNQVLRNHTLTIGGTSTIGSGLLGFYAGGKLVNNGNFNINNASSLDFADHGYGNHQFTNSITGVVNKSGAGAAGFSSYFTVFSNAGTINVNEGSFTTYGGVTQHSGTTLTGGTWNVSNGATLTFNTGSNLTTIGTNASVTLDGAASTFNRIPVTASTLTTNQGSFTLKNDRDITTANAFTNSGTVSVQDSATTLKIGATGNLAYTQTGGVTAMVGGAFIDPGVFNLNAGELRGAGTIESSVIAGAGANTIAPGLSPGTLTINGSLTLSGTSTLAMEIGVLTQGSLYDHLDVNGVLTLAGMLDLDFINDFQNAVQMTDVFTIATADSPVLGSFSNVASGGYLTTNHPIQFQVWYGAGSIYDPNSIVITNAPEPSRALLALLGLSGLLLSRRRGRD